MIDRLIEFALRQIDDRQPAVAEPHAGLDVEALRHVGADHAESARQVRDLAVGDVARHPVVDTVREVSMHCTAAATAGSDHHVVLFGLLEHRARLSVDLHTGKYIVGARIRRIVVRRQFDSRGH